jgi:succinyl-diaminopimelate desuccinylase
VTADLAAELIRVDTVNPPGNEAVLAERIGARLEAAGFRTELHPMAPGRANLVARLGPAGEPALALSGHLDTVGPGTLPWSHEPFAGERDGDRLYGRGSTDMKGGVAALIVAAERIAARGGLSRGLTVILSAGEETGCEGVRALVANPRAIGPVGALLVGEPTANTVRVAQKGVMWLRCTANGRAAHGATPHLGVNAITALARVIATLEQDGTRGRAHAVLGTATSSTNRILGGTAINVVPDRATMDIDVRTVANSEHDAIYGSIERTIGPGSVERLIDLPPVETSLDDPFVVLAREVSARITDRVAPAGVEYMTDAAVLTPHLGDVPTVILGPGEPSLAHQADEWCSIDAIERAADAYEEIAAAWCT